MQTQIVQRQATNMPKTCQYASLLHLSYITFLGPPLFATGILPSIASRYFHPCVKFLLSSRSFGQNRLLPVVVPCPWEGFLVLLASSFYFTSLHLEIWTCKDQRIAFCIHVIGLSHRLEEQQLDQTQFMWAHVWRNVHTAAVESL